MNKDLIMERIVQIEKDMATTKSNYAMLEGHMGEAKHWLAEIVKSEMAAEKKSDAVNIENTAIENESQEPEENKPKKVYKKKSKLTN